MLLKILAFTLVRLLLVRNSHTFQHSGNYFDIDNIIVYSLRPLKNIYIFIHHEANSILYKVIYWNNVQISEYPYITAHMQHGYKTQHSTVTYEPTNK